MPECNCPEINPADLDVFSLPLDCDATWKLIQSGKVKGCFQIESNLGQHWSKQILPNELEDLSALIAIVRPGALEVIIDGHNMPSHYAKRKNKITESKPLHPKLEGLLTETYDICVYQEQISRIVQKLAGFNLIEADDLRKAAAKKLPEEMAKVRKLFITKSIAHGIINEEEANTIFDMIEKSQRYLFCHAHSIAYANYSYISAYIKYHFPLEFFCSWLTFASDKPNPKLETKQLIQDAKTFNIEITTPYLPDLQPNCYISDYKKGTIRFGLVDIAGIGNSTFNKLKKIKFHKELDQLTFLELLVFYSQIIDQTTFKALIGSGALDYMKKGGGLSRSSMLYCYDKFSKLTEKEIGFIKTNIELKPSVDCISDLRYILKRIAPTKKEGGGTHDIKRKKTVEDLVKLLENPPHNLIDSVDWVIETEENLLGIALTMSRLTASDAGVCANLTCKEFLDGKNGRNLILAANIDSVRAIKTKKGKQAGAEMAFLSLSDDGGVIDGVAFPDCWKEYNRLLAEGRSVMVMGGRDNERNSFIINKVWSL